MHTPSAQTVGTAFGRKKGYRIFQGRATLALRGLIRPAGLAFCLFLFSFIKWFHIPSPFAVALICVFPPHWLMVAGIASGFGFRLAWGIDPDLWQYVGCFLLWLLRHKVTPKTGLETAVLCGIAMLPRTFAALNANPLQLLYSFAAVPAAMLFAAMLRYAADLLSKGGMLLQGQERFCLSLPVLLLIGGLGYFRLGLVNLGQAAAVATTVLFALLSGPVYGVMGGLMSGLSLILGGQDSSLAMALCLTGLFCGFPAVRRQRMLIIPAVTAANAVTGSIQAVSISCIGWWSAAVGTVIAILIPAGWKERLGSYIHGHEESDRTMENAFISQRISHMREAIESLAKALPDEYEMPTPDKELQLLMCETCERREQCQNRNRGRTKRMIALLTEGENRSGNETAGFTKECPKAEMIPELAQSAKKVCQQKMAAFRKAKYERELTLTHLAALSGTLNELGNMTLGENYHDLRAAHVISIALEELCVPARLSYARRVDGHLQAELITEGMMPVQRSLDSLLHYLQREEDITLAISRSEKGRIQLEEVPLYSASVGLASLCAGGKEAVCGDACTSKRCEGGRMLMMLCDGMGHGENAHRQSEKTLELLLLLLEAGYSRHQAITAVNGMMLGARESERFSTVDLADVDLWTGEVYSEKLGACASWVVRGSHMKKIEGASLPLGIMEEVSPSASQYRLHSGDILVMMSDGVADVFGDEQKLRDALEENLYIQPQRMADGLIRSALIAGGGAPRDDMSVMILLLMDRRQTR